MDQKLDFTPAANQNPAPGLTLHTEAPATAHGGGGLPPIHPRPIDVHFGPERMSTPVAMGIGAAIGCAVTGATVALVVWWANRKEEKEKVKPNLKVAA